MFVVLCVVVAVLCICTEALSYFQSVTSGMRSHVRHQQTHKRTRAQQLACKHWHWGARQSGVVSVSVEERTRSVALQLLVGASAHEKCEKKSSVKSCRREKKLELSTSSRGEFLFWYQNKTR